MLMPLESGGVRLESRVFPSDLFVLASQAEFLS